MINKFTYISMYMYVSAAASCHKLGELAHMHNKHLPPDFTVALCQSLIILPPPCKNYTRLDSLVAPGRKRYTRELQLQQLEKPLPFP